MKKKQYKKGGAVVKEYKVGEIPEGLTDAQLSVLNSFVPYSKPEVILDTPTTPVDIDRNSWVNDSSYSPFKRAYQGQGSSFIGNNMSGQMWADWSKIPTPIPGINDPYGESWIIDPSRQGIGINFNKVYALGGTVRYSYDSTGKLIEDPNGQLDINGNPISDFDQVGTDIQPIQASQLPQTNMSSNRRVPKTNNTTNMVQGAFDALPKMSIGTAQIVSGLAAGVNYIDAARTRQEELERMRKTLAPVVSPSNFYGNDDMPLYQEKGGSIHIKPENKGKFTKWAKSHGMGVQEAARHVMANKEDYSSTIVKRANFARNASKFKHEFGGKVFDPEGLYTKHKYGYTAEDFVVDPSLANVVAENGEFIQFPDGSTTPIYGDRHSDASGGEYMNLPEGSRIYSDKLKADKEFSSDILNRKTNKKYSISDLAKKFNTDKEDEILNDKKSDAVAKRTASFMKEVKTAKLDEIFKYQELQKNPMLAVLDDYEDSSTAPQIAALGDEIRQVRPRRGGYLGEGTPPDYFAGYSAQQVQDFKDNLYTLAQSVDYKGDPNDIAGMQSAWFNANPGVSVDYFTNVVNPTNRARSVYGVESNLDMANLTPEQVIDSAVDNIAGVRYPRLVTQTFPSIEDEVQFRKDNIPIDGGFYRTPGMEITDPYIRPGSNITPLNTTSDMSKPVGTPISRGNIPTPTSVPAIEDNTSNSFRRKRNSGTNSGGIWDYLPEAVAAVQTLNNFPIWTAKFQPKYISPIEMNIQASLNENYAQARPLLQGTGNPSIANARTNQAAANLYAANNQMFQQKFNADTQDRQRVQQYNNQLENAANQQNLERVDRFWDKVTARQANRERDINTITNSAYRKAKNKMLERESTNLINQMFSNFKYRQGEGVQFVDDGQGNIFTMPSPLPSGYLNNEEVTTTLDSEGNPKSTKIKRKNRK